MLLEVPMFVAGVPLYYGLVGTQCVGAVPRTEIDFDQLSGHLVAAVQNTMQPAHVSLWLRPPGWQDEQDNVPEQSGGKARRQVTDDALGVD